MRYHSYILFDRNSGMADLSGSEREAANAAFVRSIDECTDVHARSYGTLGLKAGSYFMLHLNAATPDAIQVLVRNLLHTTLGSHLRIPYTLMGMTRRSQYNPGSPPKESAPDSPHRYLVVYPFTKTIEWHLLPYDERRSMMKAHVDVGRKYSAAISQLLLYSFGIDDHEFIVSYQMNDLEEFQSLVMELRGTEARKYTKNDLPIIAGIHMPLADALSLL